MNPVAETRHQRRRTQTRKALLDAAEVVFTTEGYAHARIEAIAERADVSVGSIYAHFGSKDGLWGAVAERATERFGAYIDEAYRPEWGPLEQVLGCGEAYLHFHIDHPGSFQLVASESREGRSRPRAVDSVTGATRRMTEILGRFEGKIAEAMATGEARPGDARLVARFLWAAWNGTVGLTQRDDDLGLSEAELEACLQQARQVVIEGLTAPAHRRPDGLSASALVSVPRPPGKEPSRHDPDA